MPRRFVVIPRIREGDLSAAERRLLERVLRSPSLWMFQVIAGHLGLDGAVEACGTRVVPADLAAKLAACGWSADRLPPVKDIEALLFGLRVEAARLHNAARPLRLLADDLGASLAGVQRALRVVDRFAPPRYRDEGSLVLTSLARLDKGDV